MQKYNVCCIYGCETWSIAFREERRLNRVLKIIFGPKKGGFTREWRRLDDEERNDLYSPNIIRVIKSREMRWVGNIARMGRGREKPHTELWYENRREMDHLEEPGVEGRKY
jgi:hypothetical protein